MSQARTDWVDLSGAGMELVLVRVPAGRCYYVIRDAPGRARDAGVEAHRDGLRELGFRRPLLAGAASGGHPLYLLDAKVMFEGFVSAPPEAANFLRHVPGARIVPFDAGLHFIEQMEPKGLRPPPDILPHGLGPYAASLRLVGNRFRGEMARMAETGDEPAVRAAVNASIAAMLDGLSPEGLAVIVRERSDLLTKPVPTLSPGSTIADAMRTAIAMAAREDMEPDVRAALDRESAYGPGMP